MTSQRINIKIINESKNIMGDKFPVIIEYFIEDTQVYINEIEKGLAQKDPSIILLAAHTIKSSSKQLGCELLSDIAKEIEMLAREITKNGTDYYDKINVLYNILKTEASATIEAINGSF